MVAPSRTWWRDSWNTNHQGTGPPVCDRGRKMASISLRDFVTLNYIQAAYLTFEG